MCESCLHQLFWWEWGEPRLGTVLEMGGAVRRGGEKDKASMVREARVYPSSTREAGDQPSFGCSFSARGTVSAASLPF